MHDIFNPALKEEAAKQGIVLVEALRITKPVHTTKFTMGASVDRGLFKAKVNMLYDLELLDKRRDHLHHRNSGLDSTLAKLCASNNVLVGINLRNLRTLDPVLIGRVMQNIELCRAHKAKMAVFTDADTASELANPSDVQSLLLVLGMSTAQAKETIHNLAVALSK